MSIDPVPINGAAAATNGHAQVTPFPAGPNGPLCFEDQGVYTVQFEQVTFEFDYISPDRDGGIWAELEVHLTTPGMASTLTRARINLLKGNSKRDAVKDLNTRSKNLAYDWDSMMETATYWLVNAIRNGTPDIDLSNAPPSPEYATLIDPLLLTSGATILFGPGGSMKSYVALGLALSLQTGTEVIKGMPPARQANCAFLDWEWNASVHRDRMVQITGALAPGLRYMRCTMPISAERDRIRHLIREHSIEYLFIDSVAKSAGEEPETAKAANDYFSILDTFGIPALLVAHVTKHDRRTKKDTDTLFGSIFWENNARSTWSLQLSEGTPTSRLGFFHKKHNLTRAVPPFSIEVQEGDGGRLYLRRGDIRVDPALEARLPLRNRIIDVLRAGPLRVYEIENLLDVEQSQISNTLRRNERIFVKLPSSAASGQQARWALKADE